MNCQCNSEGVLRDNEATLFKRKHLITVSVDNANWRTLYRCKDCDVFWEETFEEARWVDIPILKKVDDEYVRNNWKLD